MTNVELARRVGISAPPCLRRVRTLEEQGYIRGYHADVDPRSLGFEVQVFAMVRLEKQAEADLVAFENRCRAWPLVRECHMLNGEVDFILKCVAPDMATLDFAIQGQSDSPQNARSRADAIGADLVRRLERLGVDSDDIRSTPVTLYPFVDERTQRQLVNFNRTTTVTLRDPIADRPHEGQQIAEVVLDDRAHEGAPHRLRSIGSRRYLPASPLPPLVPLAASALAVERANAAPTNRSDVRRFSFIVPPPHA